jgi:peptidyl-prolyl cis-trans isomerase A (cyclophilin A)
MFRTVPCLPDRKRLILLVLLLTLAFTSGTQVVCETTQGGITIDIFPEWAPRGANHFTDLVNAGFYTDIAFFRCIQGFLCQFGISSQHHQNLWHKKIIPDDPSNDIPFTKGTVSFAGYGVNSRTTQVCRLFHNC